MQTTQKQREALETICFQRTAVYHDPFDRQRRIYTQITATNGRKPRVLVHEFNVGMVKRLEERGLITLDAPLDAKQVGLRITDAGRAAIGDWAASER